MSANVGKPTQQVTFIYTRDLAETAGFYAEVVGLEQVLDQGSCRIFRVAGEAFLGVCARDDREVAPAGVTVTFVVDDVDGWYDRLWEAGAEIETAPEHHPEFNVHSFFVRDPSGYRLEFQRFESPHWPAASASG
ncbi:MAG: VOC family protein [Rhodovibrionaceae bacterium]|nr:VOC family protein [Rhodovibrionaceae bacterium]